MKHRNFWTMMIGLILLAVAPGIHVASAQVDDEGWTAVVRLSTDRGKASEAALFAMVKTLRDIPPAETAPTPTPVITSTPPPPPTSQP